MEGEIETADLLARTNDLLHKVGINALPIPSLGELQQSASSMFVAVFEAIFQIRLREVVRVPARSEDWISNAQVVIAQLQLLPLARNLLTPEVTGEAVVAGNPRVISQLIDIFTRISNTYPALGASQTTDSSTTDTDAAPNASRRGGPFEVSGDSGDTVPQPAEASKVSSMEGSEDDRHLSVRLRPDSSAPPPSGRGQGSVTASTTTGRRQARRATAGAATTSVEQQEGGPKLRRRPLKRQKKSLPSPAGTTSSRGGVSQHGATHSSTGGVASQGSTPRPSSARKVQRPSTSHGRSATTAAAAGTRAPRPRSAPSAGRRTAKSTTEVPFSSGGGLEAEAFGRGYPSILQSFLTQYLRKKTSDTESGKGVEQRNQRAVELRNEMYMRQYQEVVNDEERSKRLRHMAEARQAEMQAKSLAYRERVERIKATRLEETLRAQHISERMKKETLSENRMRFILKQILKRIHEWKRDEDKEELDRVKELHRYGLLKADVIESVYRERLGMVKEAMKNRKEENKAIYRAQEMLLASILRELVGLRDERVKALIERDQHRQAASLRKSDELFHTLCDMMKVEDWEGMRRDRFTTRHGSGLDKFLSQTQRGLDEQRLIHTQVIKERKLKQAYGF